MTDTLPTSRPRWGRPGRPKLSVVEARLRLLAAEFEDVGTYYAQFPGEHNALLRSEARRVAAQLRLVAVFVGNGTYSQQRGADWLHAGWRVITAIGRANVR